MPVSPLPAWSAIVPTLVWSSRTVAPLAPTALVVFTFTVYPVANPPDGLTGVIVPTVGAVPVTPLVVTENRPAATPAVFTGSLNVTVNCNGPTLVGFVAQPARLIETHRRRRRVERECLITVVGAGQPVSRCVGIVPALVWSSRTVAPLAPTALVVFTLTVYTVANPPTGSPA